MFTSSAQALAQDFRLCAQPSKVAEDFSRAVECPQATTNESARSMSGTMRRGRLTCVTRLPKQQQPLIEAVSVSPSCHEDSWHFDYPRKLVLSNASNGFTSQPITSNPCGHTSSRSNLQHTAALCAQHIVRPNSPCSAQRMVDGPAHAAPQHLRQVRTALQREQWPTTSSQDAHASWQQHQQPSYYPPSAQPQHTTSYMASAGVHQPPLSLAQLAQQHRMQSSEQANAWSPCKRQRTSLSSSRPTAVPPAPLAVDAQRCLDAHFSGQQMQRPANNNAAAPCLASQRLFGDDVTVRRRSSGATLDNLRMHAAQRNNLDAKRTNLAASLRQQFKGNGAAMQQNLPQLRILEAHNRLRQQAEAGSGTRNLQQQQRWANLPTTQGMHAAHASAMKQQRRRELADIMVHMPWLQSACEGRPITPRETGAPPYPPVLSAARACTANASRDIATPRVNDCSVSQSLKRTQSLADLQAIYACGAPLATNAPNTHARPPQHINAQPPRDAASGHDMWFAEQLVELSGLLNSEPGVPRVPNPVVAPPELDAQSCMDGSGSVLACGDGGLGASADSAAAVSAAAFVARTVCSSSVAGGDRMQEGSGENEPVYASSSTALSAPYAALSSLPVQYEFEHSRFHHVSCFGM